MEGKRKTMQGHVASNKMDKTVVVIVETSKRHPLYKKIVRKVNRYKAHDESNQCNPGDRVRIEETRPISRGKRWRVAEILSRAEMVEIKPEEVK
jgi:small subunit ribosomal protein S17